MMIVEIMTHLGGMTKIKRLFLVTTVVRLGTLDLNAGRRRNIIMRRKSKNDPKGSPSEEGMHYVNVCTKALFTTIFPNS
jgi:hypothetical protein